MGLTLSDVDDILKLIDRAELDEVRLEIGELKLHVVRRGASGALLGAPSASASPPPVAPRAVPAPETVAAAAAPAAPATTQVPEGMIAIRAPMVGTFYRSPSPGAPPFVERGAPVRADDPVCLIEVMKLFNTIPAGVDGRIADILVEDGMLVEHRQVLVLIEPASHS